MEVGRGWKTLAGREGKRVGKRGVCGNTDTIGGRIMTGEMFVFFCVSFVVWFFFQSTS